MKFLIRIFFFPAIIMTTSYELVYSQGTVPGYHDAALNRNKLLREQQGEGVYKLIGPYKVIGTSYLFGERNNGDVFTPTEKAYNIDINYNTYSQEVEFYSTANPTTALVKKPGEVDSFILKASPVKGIEKNLKFIYAPKLGFKEKVYFQAISEGPQFSLYKLYKSDLGIVSTNYIQSELRQFDLTAEYYYFDSKKNKLKKLKLTSNYIIKEFKDVKDLTNSIDSKSFENNPEVAAIKVFNELNN